MFFELWPMDWTRDSNPNFPRVRYEAHVGGLVAVVLGGSRATGDGVECGILRGDRMLCSFSAISVRKAKELAEGRLRELAA